ncbi:enolase C-terminal domain-like protein [Saccharolobus islandicus]|uniref:glucarate dehydratase n=1 Tax=Saccharolobus islandicus (strain M.16.27) TaxID=427318 RepID=C3N1N8_SACI3|nr:enolase C-terminal domain-like protein [Sulfolobus islandicus]ACP56265.1 Mandelate racemase/muconate lactonizing protein [Sulfolobus islandicus M.16.27]
MVKIRIKDVKVKSIAVPIRGKLLRVAGEHPGRNVFTLVEIITDEGVTGYGETGGGGFSLAPLIEKLKDQLIGEDAFNIRKLKWKIASPITATYYNQLLPQIWFPIETALLDIKGKALGVSISNLLGGQLKDSIEVSAYIFPTKDTETVEDLVTNAEMIVRRYGFTSIKLKTGVFKPEHEIDVVKALAEKFPHARFRIDPNGAWNLSQAINAAKSLNGIRIEYFEDPVWTMEGLRAFKQATGYTVATNTVATRFEDVPNVFLRGAVDVILGDPHWWYGIYGYLELSATLWSLGLELGMHSPSETGIALAAMLHSAAVTQNLGYAIDTHYIYLEDDIIKKPLNIENGKIKVPIEPGLGVEIDESQIEKYENFYRETGDYPYQGQKDIVTIPKLKFRNCKCHV